MWHVHVQRSESNVLIFRRTLNIGIPIDDVTRHIDDVITRNQIHGLQGGNDDVLLRRRSCSRNVADVSCDFFKPLPRLSGLDEVLVNCLEMHVRCGGVFLIRLFWGFLVGFWLVFTCCLLFFASILVPGCCYWSLRVLSVEDFVCCELFLISSVEKSSSAVAIAVATEVKQSKVSLVSTIWLLVVLVNDRYFCFFWFVLNTDYIGAAVSLLSNVSSARDTPTHFHYNCCCYYFLFLFNLYHIHWSQSTAHL